MGEHMSGVKRQVLSELALREFNALALSMAGYDEQFIAGLGDLGKIGYAKVHSLLQAKIDEAKARGGAYV